MMRLSTEQKMAAAFKKLAAHLDDIGLCIAADEFNVVAAELEEGGRKGAYRGGHGAAPDPDDTAIGGFAFWAAC
jgi:hypothetical protein